jgi:hypothetical protein
MFDPHQWKPVKVIHGTAIDVPRFYGLGYAAAIERSRETGVAIEVSGSGHVVEQTPLPGTAPEGTKVTLRFGDGATGKVAAP